MWFFLHHLLLSSKHDVVRPEKCLQQQQKKVDLFYFSNKQVKYEYNWFIMFLYTMQLYQLTHA